MTDRHKVHTLSRECTGNVTYLQLIQNAGRVHAGRLIHGVAPDVVHRLLRSDHSSDDGAVTDAYQHRKREGERGLSGDLTVARRFDMQIRGNSSVAFVRPLLASFDAALPPADALTHSQLEAVEGVLVHLFDQVTHAEGKLDQRRQQVHGILSLRRRRRRQGEGIGRTGEEKRQSQDLPHLPAL